MTAQERVAVFATAKLLELRGSVEVTVDNITECDAIVASEVTKLEATFALQQMREITMTYKGLDIKVAVFGLEGEVRVRWARWVRTNAMDSPELSCEENLLLGQSGGLKMHDDILRAPRVRRQNLQHLLEDHAQDTI